MNAERATTATMNACQDTIAGVLSIAGRVTAIWWLAAGNALFGRSLYGPNFWTDSLLTAHEQADSVLNVVVALAPRGRHF